MAAGATWHLVELFQVSKVLQVQGLGLCILGECEVLCLPLTPPGAIEHAI